MDVEIAFDVVLRVVKVVDDCGVVVVFVGEVVVLCVVKAAFCLSLTSILGTPFIEGIK